MESLKNGECVFESPWKVLELFVQKRLRTLELLYWWVGNPCRTGCGSCSSVFGSSDRVAFLVHVFSWIQVCASIFINFISILPFRVRSASPWGWRELVNFVFVDVSCLQQLQGWAFYLRVALRILVCRCRVQGCILTKTQLMKNLSTITLPCFYLVVSFC